MQHRFLIAIALSLLCWTATARADDAVHWRFGTGFDYSTGRYRLPVSTNVLLIPLSVRAYYGNWTFRVGTSFLNIHGPASVILIDEGTGVDPTGSVVPPDNRNGIGDTTLGVDYTASHLFSSAFYADVSSRVRLPTGNYNQGLGSGAVDEILNLELGADWRDYGGYVSLGRRFLGDSHGFVRKDGYQFGMGGWFTFAHWWETGAYYEYRNAVSLTLPDPKDAGAYISYRVSPEWKLQLDVSKGLSAGAATNDIGLYLTWRPDGGYR